MRGFGCRLERMNKEVKESKKFSECALAKAAKEMDLERVNFEELDKPIAKMVRETEEKNIVEVNMDMIKHGSFEALMAQQALNLMNK